VAFAVGHKLGRDILGVLAGEGGEAGGCITFAGG
jgi:hypothetical protein